MKQIKTGETYSPIRFKMVLRLARLLGSEKYRFFAVCGLGLLISSLEMVPPRIVGHLVNQMATPGFSLTPVLKYSLLWIALFVLSQTLFGVQIRTANRAGESVLVALRERIFLHLQKLPMSFFDQTHFGRILSRAWGDVDALRGVLVWGTNTLISNAAVMILASTMILTTDLKLFLSVAWLAPAMTILNFLYGRNVGRAWQEVRLHVAKVQANQAENISGMRVVAAFNRQRENLKHFRELQRINTDNNVRASSLSGVFQPMIQWVRFIGQGIILTYGGYRVASGTLQPGHLVSISLYWEWFMQPAMNFGGFFNDLLVAMSGAERIFALLDQEVEADLPAAIVLPPISGHVEFQEVSFAYQKGRPVLKGLNFKVPAGKTIALVGATGSGKSTIISLMARYYRPQLGTIRIDGVDLNTIQGDSYHRQIAMVLQNNYLFKGSILDNLKYVRPDVDERKIYEAAEKLGCHRRFSSLKDGYRTQVGERGANLSLGERQLVCFTRALLVDPKILLLDEATSAVDPSTEAQIQNALQHLVEDRTTFVVAHRLSTIVHSDMILVLDKGQIVEKGTHGELLDHNGRYARLHFDADHA